MPGRLHPAERIKGYRAEDIIGRHFSGFYPAEEREQGKPELELQMAIERGRHEDEGWRVRGDGSRFWANGVVTALRDEAGQLRGFAKVTRDVTERKRLEEQYRQAQKMEAVGQLAGGVAHDFNNLLTIITGYGELVLAGLAPDDPAHQLVTEIKRAGDRAASLTRQLLIFSRQQVLEPKVLDLNALISDTDKMLRRLIGEDVKLTCVLSPVLDRVKVDPGHVDQVIMNLAVNARDAMPQGGKLTIETSNVELDETYAQLHPEVKPGRHVMLAVTDTGCGMDDKTKARIFEPFFTTKGPGKGTGLGLATVFGIVKQSGGHIGVYSELGIGTAFKIYLPSVAGTRAPARSRPGFRHVPNGNETILLVEDEDEVRALSRDALTMFGYNVLEANRGEEAMRIARQHEGPIQMLVTDVVMPGMSGPELVEQLGRLRPDIKALYMSGYTGDAVVRHGVLQADTAFLQKPFTPTALGQKVRTVLDTASRGTKPEMPLGVLAESAGPSQMW